MGGWYCIVGPSRGLLCDCETCANVRVQVHAAELGQDLCGVNILNVVLLPTQGKYNPLYHTLHCLTLLTRGVEGKMLSYLNSPESLVKKKRAGSSEFLEKKNIDINSINTVRQFQLWILDKQYIFWWKISNHHTLLRKESSPQSTALLNCLLEKRVCRLCRSSPHQHIGCALLGGWWRWLSPLSVYFVNIISSGWVAALWGITNHNSNSNELFVLYTASAT